MMLILIFTKSHDPRTFCSERWASTIFALTLCKSTYKIIGLFVKNKKIKKIQRHRINNFETQKIILVKKILSRTNFLFFILKITLVHTNLQLSQVSHHIKLKIRIYSKSSIFLKFMYNKQFEFEVKQKGYNASLK